MLQHFSLSAGYYTISHYTPTTTKPLHPPNDWFVSRDLVGAIPDQFTHLHEDSFKQATDREYMGIVNQI